MFPNFLQEFCNQESEWSKICWIGQSYFLFTTVEGFSQILPIKLFLQRLQIFCIGRKVSTGRQISKSFLSLSLIFGQGEKKTDLCIGVKNAIFILLLFFPFIACLKIHKYFKILLPSIVAWPSEMSARHPSLTVKGSHLALSKFCFIAPHHHSKNKIRVFWSLPFRLRGVRHASKFHAVNVVITCSEVRVLTSTASGGVPTTRFSILPP